MRTLKMSSKRILAALAAFMLALSMLPVFTGFAPAYADEPTTYTVRLYAGNRGAVDGAQYVQWDNVAYGERLDISGPQVSVSDDKYYAKGIRLAGLDNVLEVEMVGQVAEDGAVSGSVYVTEDSDYVVAWGILADRVAYTVRYVDTEGAEIAPSQTFYGDVGDVPATAAMYIEGYLPNAYSITKTLTADPADNVVTFVYTRLADGYTTELNPDGTITIYTPGGTSVIATAPNNITVDLGQLGTAAGAGAAGEGAAEALGDGAGGVILDADGNPLAAPEESISDDGVALAEGAQPGDGASQTAGVPGWVIPVCIAAIVLAMALILLFYRRRKDDGPADGQAAA